MLPQGDYDQSKTKVLHLSANPASEARRCLRQDQARLQEECERLRELVSALERGGPVPADLQASRPPSSREVAGRTSPASVAAGAARAPICLSVCRPVGPVQGPDPGGGLSSRPGAGLRSSGGVPQTEDKGVSFAGVSGPAGRG